MMRIATSRVVRFLMIAAIAAAPLAAEAETLVIAGGTVHPVSGEPYVGTVVVTDGEIVAAGQSVTPPQGATTIDAAGLHVYPGLFDAFGQLGLVEVNAVAATDDQAEMGVYNPHLLAATAIHPASELIPVARANGVTHAVVAPAADGDGVIPGQAGVFALDGWTVEEMAIDDVAAMVIEWPQIVTRSFDFATFSIKEKPYAEAKEEAEKKRDELRDWLDAARHYLRAASVLEPRATLDVRLEALAGVLDGNQPVIVRVDGKSDIESAVEFAEKEGLRLVLAGGRDAWRVKELLAEKGVPVILGLAQSLPREEDDPYDQPFTAAGELVAAGVKVAFASGAGGGFGPGGPHSVRTLPYEAATAAAHGLAADEALRALTINPAEMLGLSDRLGTIEPGKVANLIVTDGSPLEITTQVHHLIIGGREVSTDNHHRRLYERYSGR